MVLSHETSSLNHELQKIPAVNSDRLILMRECEGSDCCPSPHKGGRMEPEHVWGGAHMCSTEQLLPLYSPLRPLSSGN
jgi:hypothetical protein